MLSFVAIFLAGASLLWLSKKWALLDRNIRAAKESGIPYRVSRTFRMPLAFLGYILTIIVMDGIPGYLWIATHDIFLGTLAKFAPSRAWLWPKSVHFPLFHHHHQL
jgi:hypothetical protein